MLFPQSNAFRSTTDLGGYWRLLPDPSDEGRRDGWAARPLPETAGTIAVPGAWNEQLAERGLLNYVGAAWYETEVQLPDHAVRDQRIWLRVGAADHHAEVWMNGQWVGEHAGGFLPFEVELTAGWQLGTSNRLTVRVDSTLSMTTLPQGVDPDSAPYSGPAYDRRHLYPATRFDFFPYGGLTRAVSLVTTPATRISALRIDATLGGAVSVRATTDGPASRVRVTLADADGEPASKPAEAEVEGREATVGQTLASVRPWSPASPHLYTARVEVLGTNGRVLDAYDEAFGVREVSVDGGRLLLNGEPLFMAGFGKHEDFPVVGRGQFRAGTVRDFELMRWIGANSFRTSHYPYDEEWMRLADRLGFLVIDEVPAVSLGFWSDDFDDLGPLLDTHKKTLTALVERDANHPSVVAWSTTNEPNLWSEPDYQNETSRRYFRDVYDHTKALDPSRPVIAISMAVFKEDDVVIEACDLIGINRYYGWYTNPADLERAARLLERELDATFERFGKPILITEYGVDTVPGYHSTTAQMFTEEFQTAFTETYNRVLESKPFVAGAHVWNFADFLTPQNFRRVVLNQKGVFTRDRHPKSVAFALREHWLALDRIHVNHRPEAPAAGFLVPDLKPTF